MSEKVLGLRKKDIERTIKDWKFEAYARFPSKERRYFLKTVVGIKNLENLFNRKQVPVRLASESVELKEHKIVLEENKVLKQALKYVCNQNNITYDKFWKRIKPDKWRDYIAKIIKTE